MIDAEIYPLAISRRLGHSTIAITMDIYSHFFNRKKKKMVSFGLGLVVLMAKSTVNLKNTMKMDQLLKLSIMRMVSLLKIKFKIREKKKL